jgi:hypothetical protein
MAEEMASMARIMPKPRKIRILTLIDMMLESASEKKGLSDGEEE